MFHIPASITHDISLETLINQLKQHDLVAGIVIAGSGGRKVLKTESDYDIVIVLYDYPYPVQVILTTVDERMTDVAFWSVGQINNMLNMNEIQGNIAEAAVFHWVHTGVIHYDATGKLEQLRAHQPRFTIGDNQREQFNLWYRINFNLYHGERMLQSDDDVYLLAMDFRFLYMLLEVLDAYMMNYGIPQRGEKHTIRYLRDHAPEHLKLYASALQTNDRQEKFKHYKQFAEIALKPVGGLWGSNKVTAFNLHQDMALDQYARLFDFWKELIGDK